MNASTASAACIARRVAKTISFPSPASAAGFARRVARVAWPTLRLGSSTA